MSKSKKKLPKKDDFYKIIELCDSVIKLIRNNKFYKIPNDRVEGYNLLSEGDLLSFNYKKGHKVKNNSSNIFKIAKVKDVKLVVYSDKKVSFYKFTNIFSNIEKKLDSGFYCLNYYGKLLELDKKISIDDYKFIPYTSLSINGWFNAKNNRLIKYKIIDIEKNLKKLVNISKYSIPGYKDIFTSAKRQVAGEFEKRKVIVEGYFIPYNTKFKTSIDIEKMFSESNNIDAIFLKTPRLKDFDNKMDIFKIFVKNLLNIFPLIVLFLSFILVLYANVFILDENITIFYLPFVFNLLLLIGYIYNLYITDYNYRLISNSFSFIRIILLFLMLFFSLINFKFVDVNSDYAYYKNNFFEKILLLENYAIFDKKVNNNIKLVNATYVTKQFTLNRFNSSILQKNNDESLKLYYFTVKLKEGDYLLSDKWYLSAIKAEEYINSLGEDFYLKNNVTEEILVSSIKKEFFEKFFELSGLTKNDLK